MVYWEVVRGDLFRVMVGILKGYGMRKEEARKSSRNLDL